MAAAKELRYDPRNAVYGNVAYDLDWELRERELRHAGEAPAHAPARQETVVERPKVRTETHVQVREKQKLSMFAVAGFVAVAVMAVMVLMSHIQLTALSAETVALKKEITQLQSENVVLTAQYERMFDRNTVKEAAEAAGMSKPSSSQIFYIDLSDGDSAVVYQRSEPTVLSRLATSLHHGVYAVVEYFD